MIAISDSDQISIWSRLLTGQTWIPQAMIRTWPGPDKFVFDGFPRGEKWFPQCEVRDSSKVDNIIEMWGGEARICAAPAPRTYWKLASRNVLRDTKSRCLLMNFRVVKLSILVVVTAWEESYVYSACLPDDCHQHIASENAKLGKGTRTYYQVYP